MPTNTNVTATFSKDMKWYWLMWPITSCTGCIQRFTLVKEGSTTPVDATVIYGADRTATMDPSGELEANTKYTATVKGGTDGVEDQLSNPLAEDYVWSFTTAGVTQPEDVTPPETSIDSGPSGLINDNTPTFSFSGKDDLSVSANLLYSYKVDSSSEWSAYSDQTSVTLPSLSDGGHTFYVKAKDEANNEDGSPA